MPIPYALFKNNLTPDPTDYAASVQTYRSVDFEEIAERIIEQGSTVNKPDVLAVLEGSVTAVEKFLLEGNRVVFGGLVQMFPRIRGIFDNANDEFDSSRHKLDIGANPGRRVRETVRKDGTTVKLLGEKPKPKLTEVTDVASNDIDSTLTPGNIANVTGKVLKFDALQPDEGIFLVPVAGGPDIKATSVSVNDPTFLSFLVPALPEGDYHLEVRARMSEGSEVRTGRFDAMLTVLPA